MKKLLLSSMLCLFALVAWAGDYDYLVVQLENNSTVSYTSIGLELSFADGVMTVTSSDGDAAEYSVSDLQMLYFSDAAVSGEATAIASVMVSESEPVEVYSANGSYVGRYSSKSEAQSTLQRGVYLLKGERAVVKIVKP